MLMRCPCARALSPRSLLLLESSIHFTASPICGLALWSLLGACSMYRRVTLDLISSAEPVPLPRAPGPRHRPCAGPMRRADAAACGHLIPGDGRYDPKRRAALPQAPGPRP